MAHRRSPRSGRGGVLDQALRISTLYLPEPVYGVGSGRQRDPFLDPATLRVNFSHLRILLLLFRRSSDNSSLSGVEQFVLGSVPGTQRRALRPDGVGSPVCGDGVVLIRSRGAIQRQNPVPLRL